MSDAEKIVQKKLDAVSFKRWKKLMIEINAYELERSNLMLKINQLNKKQNVLVKEMRKLWEFTYDHAQRD